MTKTNKKFENTNFLKKLHQMKFLCEKNYLQLNSNQLTKTSMFYHLYKGDSNNYMQS